MIGLALALPLKIWTIIVLLVGTALAVAMAFLRKEIAYPLVAVWAFIGIYKRTAGSHPRGRYRPHRGCSLPSWASSPAAYPL